METYLIRTVPGVPPIRFLYIKQRHSTDNWRNEINTACCKLNFFVEAYSHIIIEGSAYTIQGGDVLLYRPHEAHYGNIPYPQMIEYFEFLFPAESLEPLCGGRELTALFAARAPGDPVQMRPSDAERDRLRDLCFHLRDVLREDAHANVAALALFLEILREVCLCGTRKSTVRETSFYPAPLLAALNYTNLHFAEPVCNAEVAAAAGVSASYLNRIFRRYLHCSPHDYLLSCRISHAQKLLAEGTSVTEACFAAGFPSSSAFSTVFKRVTGTLPSKYLQERGGRR